MGIIWSLVVGGVAGFLAGQIMRGKGYGVIGNILIGIVGGVIGGALFGWLGIGGGLIGSLVTALLGAILLIFVVGLIKK